MNNKLVCPFCGETMEECKGELHDFYGCHKTSCFEKYGWFSASVLQVLIQAKQDLEIARKALKNMSLGNVPSLPDDETLANAMCNYARDTLKQIEHKE